MPISSFIFFSYFAILVNIPLNTAVSLSFRFPSFGSHDTNRFINTTGDAYISNQGIQLTPNERNVSQMQTVGRATYIDPLHLWDKKSGNLSDFSTHFSFIIDSGGQILIGDGMTFFFAPVDSSIQNNIASGGSLGLNFNFAGNSSTEPFFAVEFDTFRNVLDPDFGNSRHVGIDINSTYSVQFAEWRNNFTLGRETEAWIQYNGSSRILSVNFTGFFNNSVTSGHLSHVVDFRDYLPEKVEFGFSAASGALFQTNTIRSWEFYSNLQIDITPNSTDSSPPPESVIIPERKKRLGLVAGLSSGLSIFVLVLAFVGCFLWKKKRKLEGAEAGAGDGDGDICTFDPSMDVEFEKGTGAKKFSYSELANATNNFAEDMKVGEGGFGGVYKGFLKHDNNSCFAVKRVSRGSHQGLKEYASEVKIISQLRHRNLVQLIGWCHERGELLLVYEYLPNGSLDSHLFNKKNPVLAWDIRYKIVQGLASALLYLHEEWEQCVVHRDIKSSNIMLDSKFNTKLGDFGLARLVDHEKGSRITMVAGTRGYMAPDYVISGSASKESDVYSFGVVLLEILCGRKAIELNFPENQIRLVNWVWTLYGSGKILDAVDQELNIEEFGQPMERLLVVGLWCVHPDNRHRPSIRQALNVINFEANLPVLPSAMPVPIYYTPSMNMVTSSNFNFSISESYSEGTTHSSNFTASSTGSDRASASLLKNC